MGKIITVCGGNGSGKTTVAANLAYILSQKYIVGVVSTNTNYGAIQHIFGITIDETHGLYELMMTKIDVGKTFTPCSSNENLFILSLSNNHDCLKLADEESSLDGLTAKNILAEMKDMFNFLIIDCDTDVNNPLSIYSIIYADKIINLIKPTVIGTAFFNAYKPLFSALEINEDKIMHIANNDNNYVGIKNIEKAANIKIAMTIPYCKEVEEAENKGIPVCRTDSRNNDFAGGMKSIAERIKDGGYFEQI